MLIKRETSEGKEVCLILILLRISQFFRRKNRGEKKEKDRKKLRKKTKKRRKDLKEKIKWKLKNKKFLILNLNLNIMKEFVFLMAMIWFIKCGDEFTEVKQTNEKLNENTLLGQGFVPPPPGLIQPPLQQVLPRNPTVPVNKKKDLLWVPLNENYHPSKLLAQSGIAVREISESNTTLRVIYFATEMADPNRRYYQAPPSKYFAVYAIKKMSNPNEKFIAFEAIVHIASRKKPQLEIVKSVLVDDLNTVRNEFGINYFPPQILNSYPNLMHEVRNNENFIAIAKAFGLSEGIPPNTSSIRLKDTRNPIHPVNAFGNALSQIPLIARNIKNVLVLNAVTSSNTNRYLFEVFTTMKKCFVGLKFIENNYGSQMVSFIIDDDVKKVEDFIEVKSRSRKFRKYYRRFNDILRQNKDFLGVVGQSSYNNLPNPGYNNYNQPPMMPYQQTNPNMMNMPVRPGNPVTNPMMTIPTFLLGTGAPESILEKEIEEDNEDESE